MTTNANNNEFTNQSQKLALLNFSAAPLPPKALAQFLQNGSFSADTFTAMLVSQKIQSEFYKILTEQ